LGGYSTSWHILNHQNDMPFWITSVIALINWALLLILFKETFQPKNQKIHLFKGFLSFLSGFQLKTLRVLSISFFCLQLAWSMYFNASSMILFQYFHFTAPQVGNFMLLLGAGSCFGMTFGIRIATRLIPNEQKLLRYALILFSALFVVVCLSYKLIWLQGFCMFGLSLALAIAYTLFITTYSKQVSNEHQGWVMGVGMAVATAAWIVTSLIFGSLVTISYLLPLIFSAVAAVLSTIVLYISRT
jgi:predicted MFS family arabinose efflux permease